MSLTSGFYNSLNGDRRYTAEQMSEIFNGIINDGVFASIGETFRVYAESDNTISVGTGRAWFNSTWIDNDARLMLTADDAHVLLNRWDVVVIEVNRTVSVRSASIKIIKGVAASTPTVPELTNDAEVHQYPLAYIYREAGATYIHQAFIESQVGKSSCPFVTGILKVTNIDHIVAQWQAQWSSWWNATTSEFTEESGQWMAEKRTEVNAWFDALQHIVDGDIAASLASRMLAVEKKLDTMNDGYLSYKKLKDSEGNDIEDSYGGVIQGTLVYVLKE